MVINVFPQTRGASSYIYTKKQATRLVLLVTCLIAYEKNLCLLLKVYFIFQLLRISRHSPLLRTNIG